MPKSSFNIEDHIAYWAEMARKYPGAGWETHGEKYPCKGDFSLSPSYPTRDPSQQNTEEIPVNKTFGDGQRIT